MASLSPIFPEHTAENLTPRFNKLVEGAKTSPTLSRKVQKQMQNSTESLRRLLHEGGKDLSDTEYMQIACAWSAQDYVEIQVKKSSTQAGRILQTLKARPAAPITTSPAITLTTPTDLGLTEPQRRAFSEIVDIKNNATAASAFKRWTDADEAALIDHRAEIEGADADVNPDTEGTRRLKYQEYLSSHPAVFTQFMHTRRGHSAGDVQAALTAYNKHMAEFEAIVPSNQGRFQNPSSLCYMNAELQRLRVTPNIERDLLALAQRPGHTLAVALLSLIRKANRGEVVTRAEMNQFFHLCSARGWEGIGVTDQQDSSAFNRWLHDKVGLAEAAKLSRTTSDGTTTLSRKNEVFNRLSLYGGFFRRSPTLLADVLFASALDGQSFREAPESITQNLGRFDPDPTSVRKNKTKVRIPARMKLGEADYTPKSVVVHLGGTSFSGHYVTYSNIGGDWYYFSDSGTPVKVPNFFANQRIQEDVVSILWTPEATA